MARATFLHRKADIQRSGTEMSEQVGQMLVEHLKSNSDLAESVDFKEDNTIQNSSALYTTVLSNFIYTKEYDMFQRYFDCTLQLTPADLGMPAGAGAYQIPKMMGAKAAKLAPGEKVEYTNKNKDHIILETETYGIGTSIWRRLIKRGATGFIAVLMTNASNAVLRAVCSEIANSMVAGADDTNTVATGISIDAIADAKYNVQEKNINPDTGAPFGFVANKLILTGLGKNLLTKSEDYKTLFSEGQSNVPGDEMKVRYRVYDEMEIVQMGLVTATKSGKAVHGMVLDSRHYIAYLQETELEVFDGRIPGTAGDEEIIHAIDVGMVIMNAEACAVITAE